MASVSVCASLSFSKMDKNNKMLIDDEEGSESLSIGDNSNSEQEEIIQDEQELAGDKNVKNEKTSAASNLTKTEPKRNVTSLPNLPEPAIPAIGAVFTQTKDTYPILCKPKILPFRQAINK